MTHSERFNGDIEKSPNQELMDSLGEADLTLYMVLNPSNIADARAEFLANPAMERPNFIQGNIDRDKCEANLATIAEVEAQLPDAELAKSQRLTTDIVIDSLRNKNNFVLACDDYNHASSPETRATAEVAHRQLNEQLFGMPDRSTFYTLLAEELARIDQDALSPEDYEIYDDLLSRIGEIEPTDGGRFKPRAETVARFSEMIDFLYHSFFEHIPEHQDTFTTAEACDIANSIIFEEIGASETDYRAVMDDKVANVSVDHETRSIRFPVERAAGDFSREGLKAILVHELGTHAYRAMNFEKSNIPALSHELPGNEEIDEGIAKCCEQAVRGQYQDSGIPHYINISMATIKGKNFREVFEIQRRLRYLQGCKPGETDLEKGTRFQKANNAVFNQTMRCFRGTGVLPNCKDLVYYNGANRVWQYIEQHLDDPTILDALFLSGKSDFTNVQQERMVYEIKQGK